MFNSYNPDRLVCQELNDAEFIHFMMMKAYFYSKRLLGVKFIGRIFAPTDMKPAYKLAETLFFKYEAGHGTHLVPVCISLNYKELKHAKEITIDRILLHEMAYYVTLQKSKYQSISKQLLEELLKKCYAFEGDKLLSFGEVNTLVCSACKQVVATSKNKADLKPYFKKKTTCCNGRGFAIPGNSVIIQDTNVVPSDLYRLNKEFYDEYNRNIAAFKEFWLKKQAWEQSGKKGQPPEPKGFETVYLPVEYINAIMNYKDNYHYYTQKVQYNM